MFCQKCGAQAPEDSTFCSSCGSNLTAINTSPPSQNTHNNKKYQRRAWIWGLGPVMVFIGTILLWGVINLAADGNESDVLVFVNSIAIPFIFGINFLFFPIGIVLAIYYGIKANN